MLGEKEIKEIREHLERAKNPLFFYDDDHDGLASYLLLRRKYQKGKGICVKAALHNEEVYTKKINLYQPDKVFFLDRAILSQELLDNIEVPSVWIDHHQPVQRTNVHYYNPMAPEMKDNRPTSYWCYKVVEQDSWIAAVGILGDWHVPDFYDEFEFKELFDGKKDVEELLYESRLGLLVKVFNFAIKGKSSETKKCVSLLLKIQSPYEILNQETPRGKYVYQRYEKMEVLYQKLLKQALKADTKEDVFVFKYPSAKMSFTGEVSNELLYRLGKKKKLILIAREKGDNVRISLRSKNVKVLLVLQKALEGVEGRGGGHEYACGAHVRRGDFSLFVENLKKAVA